MDPQAKGELKVQPALPWDTKDEPKVKFDKFVGSVRRLAKTDRELVDLESVCDNYLQMIWETKLSLQ